MNQNLVMSNWISKLGDGNPAAIEIAFRRYFNDLITLASYRMKGMGQAVRSGEDLALSAINSLCIGIQDGRIHLNNEEDLWGCLFCITVRKVSAEKRREFTQKRGGKYTKYSGDAPLEDDGNTLFDSVAGNEPSPELAAQMAETADELLSLFDKESTQHKIIFLKLQGFTVQEIAEELNLLPRTIFWHLETIRKNWDFWKGMEYLIENALEGASVPHMAKYLEKTKDEITQLLDKILELWRQYSTDEECRILRLLIQNFSAFEELLNMHDPNALKVDSQTGSIMTQWISLAHSKWRDELFKIWTGKTKKSS